MPYSGGLETHEHLKLQAADAQRRAQKRMAQRHLVAMEAQPPRPRRPWWAFWRRWERRRGTDTADTP